MAKGKNDECSAATARDALRERASKEQAAVAARFFKTGKGQYGEGDVFIGVRVPAIREVVKTHRTLPDEEVLSLLHSAIHEERMLALLVWVHQFERAEEQRQKEIHEKYLEHRAHVNNWDLVDCSAPALVGTFLLERKRKVLDELYKSESLWDRRIAVVATLGLLREGELEDTFRLAEKSFEEKEDLMHKAVGWMLREAGKKDVDALRAFLKKHHKKLPRTALRYAIERFDPKERARWMEK